MRFVKLNISKKNVMYVNPSKVQTITPHTESKCMIFLQGNAYVVLHSAEETVMLLTAASNENY